MEIKGIDEKDNHIISLLRENGRMSYSDIGAEVGLSRVAVATRVKVLEEKGIIRGYTAVIDPHAAPEMMTYVVNFDIEPEHFDEVKALLNEQKELVSLFQTTGCCHLMAICVSRDTRTMKDYINGLFKSVPGLDRITYHTVLDVIKGSIIPE